LVNEDWKFGKEIQNLLPRP